MFGFVFGAICLGGLVALLVRRPGRHCGRGFGWHRHGGWHGRYGLYSVLDRLDTTPGQEKAIRAALDELREAAVTTRENVAGRRSDLAAALRAEYFEAHAVQDLISRTTSELDGLGVAAVAALGRIHDALDPEQRARLARLIESGPRFGFV